MQSLVVFFGFSNAQDQAYLQQLKTESRLLRDLFLPLDQKGKLKLLREESLENVDLPKLFHQYKDQLCLFHYGGHADGKGLALEGGQSYAEGLATLFGLQKGLKLVFLNGCKTQAQALPYLQAGVPIVIATNRAISDREATYFAQNFYEALVHQHSVLEAYQAAIGALKAQSEAYEDWDSGQTIVHRGLLSRAEKVEETPWQLHLLEGQDALLKWKLTDEIAKRKKRRLVLPNLLFVFVPILAIFLTIIYVRYKKVQQPFNFAVSLNNLSPNEYLPGPDGQVMLSYGTKTDTLDITDRVLFEAIPGNFRGEQVRLAFEAHGFERMDTSFTLNQEALYLAIRRDDTYATLEGRVVDKDTGEPLVGVRISTQGITMYSDEQGEFR